jgi:hypothetical protein
MAKNPRCGLAGRHAGSNDRVERWETQLTIRRQMLGVCGSTGFPSPGSLMMRLAAATHASQM